MITIKTTSSNELNITLEIRRIVFIEEQRVTQEEECDGKDDICSHYLAFFNDKPVGTARVRYIENKAKIERVAILKNYRGHAIGKSLMLYIIDNITQVEEIVLSSQESAIKFYEKLGFKPYGDLYYDARIPHRDMKLLKS